LQVLLACAGNQGTANSPSSTALSTLPARRPSGKRLRSARELRS